MYIEIDDSNLIEIEELWFIAKCINCDKNLTLKTELCRSKLLPCLHAMCYSCFIKCCEIGDPKCISCSYSFSKDVIYDNKVLYEIVSDEDIPNTGNIVCTIHDTTVTHWCENCKEFICEDCVKHHEQLKSTKSHAIMPKEKYVSMKLAGTPKVAFPCDLHPANQLTIICHDCKAMTCRDCQLELHKDHKFDFITDKADDAKIELHTVYSAVEYQIDIMNTALSKIEDREVKIKELKHKAVASINKECRLIEQLLKKRANELIQAAIDKANLKLEVCEQNRKKLKRNLESIKHCMKFVRGVLYTSSDPVLFYIKDLMLNRMKRLYYVCQIPGVVDVTSLRYLNEDISTIKKMISGFGTIVDEEIYSEYDEAHMNDIYTAVEKESFDRQFVIEEKKVAEITINPLGMEIERLIIASLHEKCRALSKVISKDTKKVQMDNLEKDLIFKYLFELPEFAWLLPQQNELISKISAPKVLMDILEKAPIHKLKPALSGTEELPPPQHKHPTKNQTDVLNKATARIAGVTGAEKASHILQKEIVSSYCPQVLMDTLEKMPSCKSKSALPQTEPPPLPQQKQIFSLKNPTDDLLRASARKGGSGVSETETALHTKLKDHVSNYCPQNPTEELLRASACKAGSGVTEIDTASHIQQKEMVSNYCPETWHIPETVNLRHVPINNSDMGSGIKKVRIPAQNPVIDLTSDSYNDLEGLNDLLTHLEDIGSINAHGSPQVFPETRGHISPVGLQNDNWCSVCLGTVGLISCSSCPKVFHRNCHLPAIPFPLPGQWTCILCQEINPLPPGNYSQFRSLDLKIANRLLLEMFCQVEASVPFRQIQPTSSNSRFIGLNDIKNLLASGRYVNILEFLRDINIMFKNAYRFTKGHPDIVRQTQTLREIFTRLLLKFMPHFNMNII